MPINIMFVDGAACVHEAVKWVLKDEPYSLIVFKSPLEALRALKEEEFAVVIADQMLPEMSGIDFLKKVKERSPNTMGIIMTAFVESKAAINAIRCGYVYQFVKKPLDSKKVKQAIAMAVDHHQINTTSQKLWPPQQNPHPPPASFPKNLHL